MKSDALGAFVRAAGMISLLDHGSGSLVYSPGVSGVTQEHLERFVDLVTAAERERCANVCKRMRSLDGDFLARQIAGNSSVISTLTRDDVEEMIQECVPGGTCCDPQQVADSLREWARLR